MNQHDQTDSKEQGLSIALSKRAAIQPSSPLLGVDSMRPNRAMRAALRAHRFLPNCAQ